MHRINVEGIALLVALLFPVSEGKSATTRYVDVNGSNPIPPFTDWGSEAASRLRSGARIVRCGLQGTG
jgi:hypothetical protein